MEEREKEEGDLEFLDARTTRKVIVWMVVILVVEAIVVACEVNFLEKEIYF